KQVAAFDPMTAPTKIPKKIDMTHEDPPPPAQVAGVAGAGMGAAGGSAGGIMGGLGLGSAPTPVVKVEKPKPTGPAKISSGVMAGQVLVKTTPVYPPIAKAAHVSGAVVLHAIISKTGSVEQLSVVSGPEMLRANAISAVQSWKYKPYLLNGDPTEVDTTITVNFSFGG
ncbi:MAG: energy transducer TonB, partial [Janthinobacterium lividum]